MTKKKEPGIEIVQDPERPVKQEILAEAIVRISESMQKLQASGMNERAIICLVHDAVPKGRMGAPGIGKRQIQDVFDALKTLRTRYCR